MINNKRYSDHIQDREAEYLYKSDIREAKEEGLAQGLELGREQGIQLGIEQGRQQEKIVMVQLLLKQGFSIESISTASGLFVEEIETLRKNR